MLWHACVAACHDGHVDPDGGMCGITLACEEAETQNVVM